jgi:hypothetical protein
MTKNLVTLPLRVGFGVARSAVGLSWRLAESALSVVLPGSREEPQHATTEQPRTPTGQTPSESTSPRSAPVRRTPAAPGQSDPRVNGQPEVPPVARKAPPPATPVTSPDEQADTPLSPTQDAIKTVDDTDELVAEFAEPGAEDGAGAQLVVDEPWEGYGQLKAAAIVERIGTLDPAQLAMLELYERSHRNRQSVVTAAAKRLQALSPPHAE